MLLARRDECEQRLTECEKRGSDDDGAQLALDKCQLHADALDTAWVLLCAALIFLMQLGFAMLEAVAEEAAEAAATPLPGTTPCRHSPSNTATRPATGATSHPFRASRFASSR